MQTVEQAVGECVCILAEDLHFGEDGQDEGGRLVGIEGRRYDDVFARFQQDELHDLASIQVHFRLGNRCLTTEECSGELSPVCLVLENSKCSTP